MTVTHTKDLLFEFLNSCHGLWGNDVKSTEYTRHGTEAIFEYNGSFYRIVVEHLPAEERK